MGTMSRKRSFILASAILGGCSVVAVTLVALRSEPARRTVPTRIPFVSTTTVAAGKGAIPVYGAGTVRPRAEVDVTAEVAGRVVWVASDFQSGGRVHAGQPLFRIDDSDYQNKVEQARASVASQEVELLRVAAEAQIARDQYEQFKRLETSGEWAENPAPLASWEPQLEAARAALARDRALLQEAELALARTEVRAPFDAAVLEEFVDVGQYVMSAHSVGRLYATDAVEIVAPLADASAALIPGLWTLSAGNASRRVPARVIADFGDDRFAWDGYVDRAKAALDKETRTIEVVVRVPDPFTGGAHLPLGTQGTNYGSTPLLVGKFVEVLIDGRAPGPYFRVRRAALRTGNELWVVHNDTVSIIPVRVLQRSDDEVFLTGALEAGQSVIIGGIQVAVEGMPVRTSTEGEP